MHFSKALEVLEKEYSTPDGLDAKTLLDSKINGGLTYNDFLILPGHIGMSPPRSSVLCCLNALYRLRCLRSHTRYTRYKENFTQNTASVVADGHSYRALNGHPYGFVGGSGSHTPQLLG